MVIWLVMVMLNTVAPIHVGNFNSMDACEKAAQAAVQINPKASMRDPYLHAFRRMRPERRMRQEPPHRRESNETVSGRQQWIRGHRFQRRRASRHRRAGLVKVAGKLRVGNQPKISRCGLGTQPACMCCRRTCAPIAAIRWVSAVGTLNDLAALLTSRRLHRCLGGVTFGLAARVGPAVALA